MKIWTVTYNDDNGVRTEVFNNEDEQLAAAETWTRQAWDDEETWPTDWSEAYEELCDTPGFIDSISLEEHQISIPEPTDPTEKAYVEAAKRIHTDEGTVEVDDNAIVSISEDGGAYVSAWVWVYNDQADVCDDCGTVRRADGQCDCEVEE